MIMEAAFVVCNHGIDQMNFHFPVSWRAVWITVFSECYACWFQAKINFGKFSLQLQSDWCVYGLFLYISFIGCYFFHLTYFLFCTRITCLIITLRVHASYTTSGTLLYSNFSFPILLGFKPALFFELRKRKRKERKGNEDEFYRKVDHFSLFWFWENDKGK